MRKVGFVLTLLLVTLFAVPPTLHAECYSRSGYIAYYPSCGCNACTGWAISNCTECWNSTGGSCITTSSNGYCEPRGPRNQDF
jgi:hypothetical protein